MTPAIPPIRNAPHGDTEPACPTHIRVTPLKLSITRVSVGSIHPVLRWEQGRPVIRDDAAQDDILTNREWEPANPPAPVAADTPRPHNPHGSLNFDAASQPAAFDACLALVRAFDDVSDETVAMIIAGIRNDRLQMWIALQAARTALVAEGFRP